MFLGLFYACCSEDPPRVRIDQQRYADLLEDPYARRILGVIFHVGRGDGNYRFTLEEEADKKWFDAEGTKTFPVLLEVLKREPSPLDSPAPPYAWLGVQMQRDILGLVKRSPEGDLQPFVEETRRQIARWIGFPSTGKHTLVQLLSEGFDLLAQEGDESDIALIGQFVEDGNPGTREIALGNIKLLKARFEAEKAGQPAPDKVDPPSNQRVQAFDPGGNSLPPTPGNAAATKTRFPPWLKWAISLLVAAGIFWHWRWRVNTKRPRGSGTK